MRVLWPQSRSAQMYVVCMEPRLSSYTAGRSGDSTQLCVHGFVWRSADITSSTQEHVSHAREAYYCVCPREENKSQQMRRTSLIFSLQSLYCFFWLSRKVVSSFFCWATICCWNFFSSVSKVFIWEAHGEAVKQMKQRKRSRFMFKVRAWMISLSSTVINCFWLF